MPSSQWEITRKIWAILFSWGTAVLILATLFSWWIYSIQQDQEVENLKVQREQDRAMCVMIDVFVVGPEPVIGPNGERQRAIRDAMLDYQKTLHCEDFRLEPPVEPRTRPS